MARTKQTARKANTGGTNLQPAVKSPRRSSRTKPKSKSPRRGANRTGFTSSEESDDNMPGRNTRAGNTDDGAQPGTSSGGGGGGGGASRVSPPRKDIKIPKKPKKTMKELVGHWNRSARIGKVTETAQGWLKKTDRKRDAQNNLLRRAKPGSKALLEIRHYQRCQTFLIPTKAFARLVREVCDGVKVLRWQSNALFTLQGASEAYMGGFFNDVNLCALHRKVKTINRKDVWLAVQIRGREHVGGRPTVSDVGAYNTSALMIADTSEQAGVEGRPVKGYAQEETWDAKFRGKVTPKPVQQRGRKSRKGKGPAMKRRRLVLADASHGITRPAICRMARRGGVARISAMIYEECRGVLKAFLEEVIRDVVTYCEYAHRKTVTPIDVIYALKRHGRNIYGFTKPYSYSHKKQKASAPAPAPAEDE